MKKGFLNSFLRGFFILVNIVCSLRDKDLIQVHLNASNKKLLKNHQNENYFQYFIDSENYYLYNKDIATQK